VLPADEDDRARAAIRLEGPVFVAMARLCGAMAMPTRTPWVLINGSHAVPSLSHAAGSMIG
jgi:hypothetical protein